MTSMIKGTEGDRNVRTSLCVSVYDLPAHTGCFTAFLGESARVLSATPGRSGRCTHTRDQVVEKYCKAR